MYKYLTYSLLLCAVGIALSNSTLLSICTASDYACRDILNKIGDPLFYGMGAFSIIFFALLMIPRAYRTWQRFAVWYLPFAISLFFFYRDPGSGDLFSPYPEQVYQWVAGIFVVLSLVVIAVGAKFGKANDTSPLIRYTFLRILWVLYVAYLVYSVAIHYY